MTSTILLVFLLTLVALGCAALFYRHIHGLPSPWSRAMVSAYRREENGAAGCGSCMRRRREAFRAAGEKDPKAEGEEEEEEMLTCVISDVDGDKYCVRERKHVSAAVDLLARVMTRVEDFVRGLQRKYPDDPDVRRLGENFDKHRVSEILPTSVFEAVTTNKGEQVEFCLLSSKRDVNTLIDEHTLTFVALHEVTHIMCPEEFHTPLFWRQFRFLLQEARVAGVHEPRDYSRDPVRYCDRPIQDSPYFQWSVAESGEFVPVGGGGGGVVVDDEH